MPLALFVVVGLGALALAIGRMSSSSNTSALYEGISVQALYAAESAAQYAMHRLLFDATSAEQVNDRCGLVEGETVQFNVAGLSSCNAQLSCSASTVGNPPVYTILSRGVCGGGGFKAERTIQAAVAYE